MNIYDLQDRDREVVEKILRKERTELTAEDVVILKARKDYVRSDEWERLMGEDKFVVTQENNNVPVIPEKEEIIDTPVEKVIKVRVKKVKRNKRKAANSK